MFGNLIGVKTTCKSKAPPALPVATTLDTKLLCSESVLRTFITFKFSALGPQQQLSICFRESQREPLVYLLELLNVSSLHKSLHFDLHYDCMFAPPNRAHLALIQSRLPLGAVLFHQHQPIMNEEVMSAFILLRLPKKRDGMSWPHVLLCSEPKST